MMPPAEILYAENVELKAEVGELRQENSGLRQRLAEVQLQLQVLLKRQYGGGKSEKLDVQQLQLKLEELAQLQARLEAPKEQIHYERRRPDGEKRPVPAETFAHLPVRERVTLEPEEVQTEPEAYERIGEEETFEVDVTPPVVFKRVIVRPKYRRKDDRTQAPVVAPARPRAVAGGYASAGLLAWVAVSKYLHHLPLYRQEQMFRQWGVAIPRQSMAEWIRIAAEWLEPIYRHMRERLVEGSYVQVDETPVRCNDPDEKRGKTVQGYLWVMSRPDDDVVFDWRLSRRHGELTSLVEGFKGLLQADGYEAYAAHARTHPEVMLVGCWAHVRRKFIEAQGENPRLAMGVLRLIGRLYRWEREWDALAEDGARDPIKRGELREQHYPPVLRALKTIAMRWHPRVLPRSGMGKALGYLLGQWDALARHGDQGMSRLDNNLVENAIRPSAIGKKNWLFVGHPEAGKRAAILYSIILSCQRHGKDPLAYLRHVLGRLPYLTNQDDLSPLTPRLWQPPIEIPISQA